MKPTKPISRDKIDAEVRRLEWVIKHGKYPWTANCTAKLMRLKRVRETLPK